MDAAPETRGASAPAPATTRRPPAGRGAWFAAWCTIACGVACVSWSGPLGSEHAPIGVLPAMVERQFAWGLASAAWLACLAWMPRGGPGTRGVVLGAVLLRLLAIVGDPGSSDDIHRYVWEGGLVAEGVSPYAFSPNAARLADERERWSETYGAMNNTEVSAAYPPATQALHAAVVSLAGGPAASGGGAARCALRWTYALCDLLVLLPLAWLLRARGRGPAALVVWAWSPLVVLEFAGAGHFDAFGILCLVLGLALWSARSDGEHERRARAWLGALAFGVGIAVKWLPVLALPFAARRRPARAVFALGIAAALFLPLGLLEGGWSGLTAGLGEYGLRWEAGSLVHRWIEAPIARYFERDAGAWDARRLSRIVVGALLAGVAAWTWLRERDPVRACGTVFGAFLVLTPTLHPWYVTWIVPFLAFSSGRAFALLAALAPLLYWPLAGWHQRGEWIEPTWLWWGVAMPVLGLALIDRRRARVV